VHLARQTGGDRGLEEEVLQLFLRQAAALGRQMEEASDNDTLLKAAHNIKGAARAVGAFDVAALANDLEDHPTEKRCVLALVEEINSTCDYISSLLR
jgi:HPt (histidine-containing phosphotransfer) domain-containing protein